MLKIRPTAALLVALGLVPACCAAAAENWADAADAKADPAYQRSRAICQAAKGVRLPPAGPGDAALGQNCASETLFYGIGVPADPTAARRCALGERAADPDNADAFAGTAMLMTMFANGVGAPRDLDVATALACTLSGASEEMDARVNHLALLKAKGPDATPFSVCDDVTSGSAIGACAAHDSRLAGLHRDEALDGLSRGLAPVVRTAFTAARHAADAFAAARGDNEIDLSGTARAAFELEAEDAVKDGFLDLQQRLAARTLAPVAGAEAEAGDKALNAAYQAVMAVADPQWGTASKPGIKATQRAWLAYRDAAAAAAGLTYGASVAGDVKAWLTSKRTAQLKPFLS